MKNHFKSQLVMNRFNKKLWYYDMEEKILVQKQSQKMFFERDIYTPEIERKLGNLESQYSHILDTKVLNQKEIELTRKELYTIKKFLLVDSIRQMYEKNQFDSCFKSFEPAARLYFKAIEINTKFDDKEAQYLCKCLEKSGNCYLSELEMSEKEKFFYSLECILDNDLRNLFLEKCPLDIIAWSAAMTESYLTFWDSNESEEFILTDTNMISEYDMCHMIYGGLNSEKKSYISKQLSSKGCLYYFKILKTMTVMYENYNIFNISSDRCIVCISPFFKLYSNRLWETSGKENKIKPDIWPSVIIRHLEAFEIPINSYISAPKKCADDLFKYIPYKLTKEETIAMNMQFLNESRKFVGFVKKEKVVNTFAYANAAYSYYESSKAKNYLESILVRLNSVRNNKFYPIIKMLDDDGIKFDINPFELFENETKLSIMGMETNYYMYEYLIEKLKNKMELNLEPFKILNMKSRDELIAFFTERLEYAKKNNKKFIATLYNNK